MRNAQGPEGTLLTRPFLLARRGPQKMIRTVGTIDMTTLVQTYLQYASIRSATRVETPGYCQCPAGQTRYQTHSDRRAADLFLELRVDLDLVPRYRLVGLIRHPNNRNQLLEHRVCHALFLG
jgi:hypothetical protein